MTILARFEGEGRLLFAGRDEPVMYRLAKTGDHERQRIAGEINAPYAVLFAAMQAAPPTLVLSDGRELVIGVMPPTPDGRAEVFMSVTPDWF